MSFIISGLLPVIILNILILRGKLHVNFQPELKFIPRWIQLCGQSSLCRYTMKRVEIAALLLFQPWLNDFVETLTQV